MKRTVLLSALLVIATAFTACSNSPGNDTPVTAAPVVTEAETNEELSLRESAHDNLPQLNFDGGECRIAIGNDTAYEVYSESETGDVCNDIILTRNRNVEERLGITIKPVVITGTDIQNDVKPVILANDDAYELISLHACRTGVIALNNMYMNWHEIPYVEFNQPWYVQSVVNEYTIDGVLFDAVGDYSITSLMYSYALFFNSTLAADYNVTGVYNDVYDGKWTLERLQTVTSNVYTDLNGDNKADKNDLYGFAITELTGLDAYMPSFGINIMKKNADGLMEFVYNNEKAVTAFERMYSFLLENVNSYCVCDGGSDISIFTEGRALFCTTTFNQAFSVLRDMSDDYVILPMVKLDEQQEIYMTNSKDWYSVYGVPVTASNTELVGAAFEALNSESYKIVYPVYFETALKAKYARDPEAIAMLDMIVAGRNYDFVITDADNFSAVTWLFRNSINTKSNAFASQLASNENSINKKLDKINAYYSSYGD